MRILLSLRSAIIPRRVSTLPGSARFPLPQPASPFRAPLAGAQHFSQTRPRLSDPVPPDYLNESELAIFNKLKTELQPSTLEVQDISGGCGSMYALEIVSSKFAGLPVIKQHRLVNQILGDEIKKWHGVQLKTRAE